MALKFKLDADAHGKLDDSLQALYKKGDDGEFTLDLDGDIPGLKKANTALNEFRANNVRLKKERDKLKADLEAAQGKVEDKNKGLTETEKRLAKLEERWKASETAREKAEARVARADFRRIVRKAAKGAGVTDAALDDATDHLRHRRGMVLADDGKSVAAEDGTTLDEALTSMRKESGYFFAESTGGGTPPGSGGETGDPPKEVDSVLDNVDDIISGKAAYKASEEAA